MNQTNNYINLLKKKNYISYLTFILFINSKHWIFLLFNNIYTFFNKLILLNKNQIKESKDLNFISFFKKTNLNLNRCLLLNNIINKLVVWQKRNIYFFILNIIIFLKKVLINISTYFFNIFFKDLKFKNKSILKNNFKMDKLNVYIDRKINFYCINNNYYSELSNLYLFDTLYYDNYSYNNNNNINVHNIYKMFNNILNIKKWNNKPIVKYNYTIKKNMLTFLKNNINILLNKPSLFYDFSLIRKSVFFYIISIFFTMFNLIKQKKQSIYKTRFYFSITNYKLKDIHDNLFTNNILYNNITSKEYYFLKKSNKDNIIFRKQTLNNEKESFVNTELASFTINNEIFFFIKKNISLIGRNNWILLCNYYYNNINFFKEIILYLFNISNTNKNNLYFYKYYLLYNDINLNYIINKNFFKDLNVKKIEMILKKKFKFFLNLENEYYIQNFLIKKKKKNKN